MRTAKETIPDYLSAFPYRLVIFGGAKLCCFLNRNAWRNFCFTFYCLKLMRWTWRVVMELKR